MMVRLARKVMEEQRSSSETATILFVELMWEEALRLAMRGNDPRTRPGS